MRVLQAVVTEMARAERDRWAEQAAMSEATTMAMGSGGGSAPGERVSSLLRRHEAATAEHDRAVLALFLAFGVVCACLSL